MAADWALTKAIEVIGNFKVTPETDRAPLEDKVADLLRSERERCRRIANRYEKGPEEQARIAGAIRTQIEEGR